MLVCVALLSDPATLAFCSYVATKVRNGAFMYRGSIESNSTGVGLLPCVTSQEHFLTRRKPVYLLGVVAREPEDYCHPALFPRSISWPPGEVGVAGPSWVWGEG